MLLAAEISECSCLWQGVCSPGWVCTGLAALRPTGSLYGANQFIGSGFQRALVIGSLFVFQLLFQILSHKANITRGKTISFSYLHRKRKNKKQTTKEQLSTLSKRSRDSRVWGVLMFGSPENLRKIKPKGERYLEWQWKFYFEFGP